MGLYHRLVLRGNGMFLGVSGAVSFVALDIRGIFFGSGPVHEVLRGGEVSAGLGFLEAHGLAVILAVNLVVAGFRSPERGWHLTALATELLLAGCNIALWRIFVVSDILWMGFATTALHLLFALLQGIAALTLGTHHHSGRAAIV